MRCLQAAALGLSRKDIRIIMEEADEDGDGMISYSEFVSVATEVLQAVRAKAKAFEDAAARNDAQLAQSEEILINGMSQDELTAALGEVFTRADATGSGVLDRAEFRRALQSSDIGLKRTDVNLLMAVADEDSSGEISYVEFIPLVYGVLAEKIRREIANGEANDLDAIGERLLADLMQFDETGDGHCDKRTLKRAMRAISKEWIGLTRIQLSSVLSLPEAERDETGLVNLMAFVPAAASALEGIVVVEKQRQRAAAQSKIAQTFGARILADLDEEQVKRVLLEAFIAHDADGSGALDANEAEALLRSVGVSELGLTERQVDGLLAAMDEDGAFVLCTCCFASCYACPRCVTVDHRQTDGVSLFRGQRTCRVLIILRFLHSELQTTAWSTTPSWRTSSRTSSNPSQWRKRSRAAALARNTRRRKAATRRSKSTSRAYGTALVLQHEYWIRRCHLKNCRQFGRIAYWICNSLVHCHGQDTYNKLAYQCH